MLWLPCPNCGRAAGRGVRLRRRAADRARSDHRSDAERDVDYVWMFDNVRGVTTERWFHHAGCRRWHTVRRDTATDTVMP